MRGQCPLKENEFLIIVDKSTYRKFALSVRPRASDAIDDPTVITADFALFCASAPALLSFLTHRANQGSQDFPFFKASRTHLVNTMQPVDRTRFSPVIRRFYPALFGPFRDL
jgi:hypothetical protein